VRKPLLRTLRGATIRNGPLLSNQQVAFRRRNLEYLANVVCRDVDPVDMVRQFFCKEDTHPLTSRSNDHSCFFAAADWPYGLERRRSPRPRLTARPFATANGRTGLCTAASVSTRSADRSLFDSIDQGFCIIEVLFDAAGRAIDYRFLDVNPAFTKQTGLVDAVGRRMRELAPAHEDHWFQIYGQVAQTGVPMRFEQPAEALRRWFSVFAFRVGDASDRRVAILFQDITKEKKTLGELHASEKRYRAFAYATSTAVYRVSGDGSSVLEVYGGLVPQHLNGALPFGAGLDLYVHPEDRTRVVDVWRTAFSAAAPFEVEHRVRLADGSWQWVHSRAVPVRADDGQIIEWIGSVTDITERKQNEQDLRQSESMHQAARAEAERANSAKDSFLAMVGHELRNPLAPMRTALELMRRRHGTSREQEILERQVKHLARLVDDLLDAARTARGKVVLNRRPVEVCAVVARAIETSAPILDRYQHQLDVQVASSGLTIDADAERMAQVVSNLLTNAAKFSETGSQIRIEGRREGNMVRLTVKDHGIGIPPDMLDAVFEPFVQHSQAAHRSRSGLGLGLAIARNLVEAHGGSLRAISDGPQRGSEFVLELPAVDDVPADTDVSCSDERWHPPGTDQQT
jgi:signal transduction histidine kinase